MASPSEYLITGVTGLIGSHVLFALLERCLKNGTEARVHALIRAGSDAEAQARIDALLRSVVVPESLRDCAAFQHWLRPIPGDLTAPELPDRLAHLRTSSTSVIHCAGSTNLTPGAAADADVIHNNTRGTRNLLNSTRGVGLFSYVSTAYSCGLTEDVVRDNYRQTTSTRYRNSYEQQKAIIENELRGLTDRRGSRIQILRPAVVCGRLQAERRFVTSKFDVFYGWAKFFWAYRHEVNRLGVRIWIHPEGTLNIVPVDYVAQAILAATERPSLTELNIVSSNPPRHEVYFREILADLGVHN